MLQVALIGLISFWLWSAPVAARPVSSDGTELPCDCCCAVLVGERPLADCPECDVNSDGEVTVLDLVSAGCRVPCEPTPAPTPTPTPDCGCCCAVLLGAQPLSTCPECDTNGDLEVKVGDLVSLGCPLACDATPTPTPTPDCGCCCAVLLGEAPLSSCANCDVNQDGEVRVHDLMSAGCWFVRGPGRGRRPSCVRGQDGSPSK